MEKYTHHDKTENRLFYFDNDNAKKFILGVYDLFADLSSLSPSAYESSGEWSQERIIFRTKECEKVVSGLQLYSRYDKTERKWKENGNEYESIKGWLADLWANQLIKEGYLPEQEIIELNKNKIIERLGQTNNIIDSFTFFYKYYYRGGFYPDLELELRTTQMNNLPKYLKVGAGYTIPKGEVMFQKVKNLLRKSNINSVNLEELTLGID